jgi:hypothetical protein
MIWVFYHNDEVVSVTINGFKLAPGHENEEQANCLAKSLGETEYGIYRIETNTSEFKKVL